MGVEDRDKHVCATPSSTAARLALGVIFLPVLLDLNSSLSLLSRLPASQQCQSHISQPLGLLFPPLLPLAVQVSPAAPATPALCLPSLPRTLPAILPELSSHNGISGFAQARCCAVMPVPRTLPQPRFPHHCQ